MGGARLSSAVATCGERLSSAVATCGARLSGAVLARGAWLSSAVAPCGAWLSSAAPGCHGAGAVVVRGAGALHVPRACACNRVLFFNHFV